ncbi:protein transport protein bos1 [Tilletia horrida]|uniref:Protein transport protein BOS1 n=1 Tax=Tilletia horrida TaxID=155126 RepID=A0AAN6GQH5_9BASI|nr:protein transport protein bos1 [Tilletia horrida]KAK0553311.1 protein transport protein bos1 [Tilletia horrida]KAK0567696.1 protein transport protein bos1 [Tilletia horrida]
MASSLYNLGLRQSSSLRADLARLDSTPDDASLIGQITATLAAFSRTVDDYEGLARRELVPAKQEKSFARTKKFRDDAREFESQFAKIKAGGGSGAAQATQSSSSYALRSPGAASAESPYSLHARNSTAQYGGAPSPRTPYSDNNGPSRTPDLGAYQMNASAAAMFGGAGGSNLSGTGMSAREGHALREHSFIQQTEIQLDNFIAQGREVWGNLTEQRDILKETQRKLLNAANTLGLSRDVIGYIERRSTQDNIIFVVGAIFTLVCFYYIYKWFG